MTDLVWMATARKGLSWHAVNGRRTVCGRYIGDTDGKPQAGVLVERTDPVLAGAQQCVRCSGDFREVKPNPVPTKGEWKR